MGWEIKQVLYADDTVLVAGTSKHIQLTLSDFERTCDSMGLKINARKRKVLTIKKDH